MAGLQEIISSELVLLHAKNKIESRQEIKELNFDKYNFTNKEELSFKSGKGISESIVKEISALKNEPEWMTELRLKALKVFNEKPLPAWGPDLSGLNYNELNYYLKPKAEKTRNWQEVPKEIKETFDRLGIPEAEKKYLAGSVAQYEGESIYHNIKKEWEEKGVIFTDMDTALKEHEELIKQYFMKAVPVTDNKFSALHAAFWSGGSFLYVPENIQIDLPFQTYFRMNAESEGQFEHTLIVAEKNSKAAYIEGCTAPKHPSYSLHSAVVEIYVKENSSMRYTTVQNWSKSVYNLNTKRAIVDRNARMEWVGGSMGSFITMLYPCSILRGEGASAQHLNIAFGSGKTWKDGGAKVIHLAKNTSSNIIAKSISMNEGRGVYRGLVRINKGAMHAKSHIQCDALILDEKSGSDAFPHNEVLEPTATLAHEATVNRISDEQVFYLMSRGLSEAEARAMIVLGFLHDVYKEIPMEFAVEFSRLVSMEMEKLGSVG